MPDPSLSGFENNRFNTTDLTLSVMWQVARRLGIDIHDNDVSDRLYWICCGLESHPEGHGFGSSDSYGYVLQAREDFGIPES